MAPDDLVTSDESKDDSSKPAPIEIRILRLLAELIQLCEQFISRRQSVAKPPADANARTARFTLLIFFATMAYAITSFFQWRAMEKMNGLYRQQLESTSAAIVRVSDGNPVLSNVPPIGNTIEQDIGFRNEGIAIAEDVEIHAQVSILHVADKTYKGSKVDCSATVQRIAHDKFGGMPTCRITGLSDEEARLINTMDDTIALDGQFRYWDGFSWSESETLCYRYQPVRRRRTKFKIWADGNNNGLIDCAAFERAKEDIANSVEPPTSQ
jgi:hypothetical protein